VTTQEEGLCRLGDSELVARYCDCSPALVVPAGRFRGRLLSWLPRGDAASRRARPLLRSMFGSIPGFGVDFDDRRWFFGHRALKLGRFELSEGPSLWHETETFRMLYDSSRLPLAIRSQLYDEIKPLGDSLCLGVGGLGTDDGPKAQFFFLLRR